MFFVEFFVFLIKKNFVFLIKILIKNLILCIEIRFFYKSVYIRRFLCFKFYVKGCIKNIIFF